MFHHIVPFDIYLKADIVINSQRRTSNKGAQIRDAISLILQNEQSSGSEEVFSGYVDATAVYDAAVQYLLKHPYEALSLQENAQVEKIRTSYKKLALKYHPDRNPKTHSIFLIIKTCYDGIIEKALTNSNQVCDNTNDGYPDISRDMSANSRSSNCSEDNKSHDIFDSCNIKGFSKSSSRATKNDAKLPEVTPHEKYGNFSRNHNRGSKTDQIFTVPMCDILRREKAQWQRKEAENGVLKRPRTAAATSNAPYNINDANEQNRKMSSRYSQTLNAVDHNQFSMNHSQKARVELGKLPSITINGKSFYSTDITPKDPHVFAVDSTIAEIYWSMPPLLTGLKTTINYSVELSWRLVSATMSDCAKVTESSDVSLSWTSSNKLIINDLKCRKRNLIAGNKYEFRLRAVIDTKRIREDESKGIACDSAKRVITDWSDTLAVRMPVLRSVPSGCSGRSPDFDICEPIPHGQKSSGTLPLESKTTEILNPSSSLDKIPCGKALSSSERLSFSSDGLPSSRTPNSGPLSDAILGARVSRGGRHLQAIGRPTGGEEGDVCSSNQCPWVSSGEKKAPLSWRNEPDHVILHDLDAVDVSNLVPSREKSTNVCDDDRRGAGARCGDPSRSRSLPPVAKTAWTERDPSCSIDEWISNDSGHDIVAAVTDHPASSVDVTRESLCRVSMLDHADERRTSFLSRPFYSLLLAPPMIAKSCIDGSNNDGKHEICDDRRPFLTMTTDAFDDLRISPVIKTEIENNSPTTISMNDSSCQTANSNRPTAPSMSSETSHRDNCPTPTPLQRGVMMREDVAYRDKCNTPLARHTPSSRRSCIRGPTKTACHTATANQLQRESYDSDMKNHKERSTLHGSKRLDCWEDSKPLCDDDDVEDGDKWYQLSPPTNRSYQRKCHDDDDKTCGVWDDSSYRHIVRNEPIATAAIIGYLLPAYIIQVRADCGSWLKVKVHEQAFHHDQHKGQGEYSDMSRGDGWGWCLAHDFLSPDFSFQFLPPATTSSGISEASPSSASGSAETNVEVWHETYDEESGYFYYYNHDSNESKWESPEWIEEFDQSSNRSYYVQLDVLTSRAVHSTWTKPMKYVQLVRSPFNCLSSFEGGSENE